MRDADEDAVIEAVRVAGLANQKGPRIQTVLRQIQAERGGLDLTFLQDMSVEEARAWLLKFKGVGPKTAAIVLLFSLDMPDFPVDTHIYRLSGRLGLRPEKMSADKTHQHLAELLPPDTYYDAHLNLIRHGRQVCHARTPACQDCPLNIYISRYPNHRHSRHPSRLRITANSVYVTPQGSEPQYKARYDRYHQQHHKRNGQRSYQALSYPAEALITNQDRIPPGQDKSRTSKNRQ